MKIFDGLLLGTHIFHVYTLNKNINFFSTVEGLYVSYKASRLHDKLRYYYYFFKLFYIS